MALSSSALKSLLVSEIESAITAATGSAPIEPKIISALAEGIAKAVVTHITSDAVVNTTGIGNLGNPVSSTGTIS